MKKFVVAILLSFGLLSVSAAEDSVSESPKAVDFFNRAPMEIASQLSKISRLDMVDFYTSGSTVKSQNRLGRKVAIKELRDNMISWQDDDSVTVTIAVLPSPRSFLTDTALLVIRTLPSPLADSEIKIYTTNWGEVNNSTFQQPKLKDWLDTSDRKIVEKAEEQLPFMLVTASFDPDTETLVLTNRTANFFVEGDKPEILKYLKPELRYQWKNIFVKQK